MFQPKTKKKKNQRKAKPLDLTNAPVKRKAANASRRGIAARAGEVSLMHGRDAELLEPPVYRVERTRNRIEPTPGTEF